MGSPIPTQSTTEPSSPPLALWVVTAALATLVIPVANLWVGWMIGEGEGGPCNPFPPLPSDSPLGGFCDLFIEYTDTVDTIVGSLLLFAPTLVAIVGVGLYLWSRKLWPWFGALALAAISLVVLYELGMNLLAAN